MSEMKSKGQLILQYLNIGWALFSLSI